MAENIDALSPEQLRAKAAIQERDAAAEQEFLQVLRNSLASEQARPPHLRNAFKITNLLKDIATYEKSIAFRLEEAKRLRDRAAELEAAMTAAIAQGLTPEAALELAQASARRKDVITKVIIGAAILGGIALIVTLAMRLFKR